MDIIRNLVKSLLAFLLFETMVGQLLGHTPYEKFAKLFTGLLLILIMLSPLISAFKLWDTLNWNMEAAFINQEKAAKSLEGKMESLEEKTGLLREYKNQLNLSISQWFLKNNGEVKECSLKINKEDGSIEKISIVYEGDEKLKKEAENMLINTFNLKNGQIDIRHY